MEGQEQEKGLFNFEIQDGMLLASWDESVQAESAYFLETIQNLMALVKEQKIRKIFLDSGTPAGGVLTEEVMETVQANIVKLRLDKVAVLESTDFHWDNNLMQFLQYLKAALPVHFKLKSFCCKTEALSWLAAPKESFSEINL